MPMDWITGDWPSGLLSTVAIVVAVLLAHMVVWRLVLRLMKDRDLADGLGHYLRWPARAVVTLAALAFALPSADLPRAVHGRVFHTLLLALVAAGAWLAVRVVRVAEDALMRRYDVGYRQVKASLDPEERFVSSLSRRLGLAATSHKARLAA